MKAIPRQVLQQSPVHLFNGFYTKIGNKWVRIRYEDLIYIQGDKDYINVHTACSAPCVRRTLSSMVELLPKDRFVRIHNSYIVSLDKVETIGSNYVEVRKKDKLIKLPLGRRYKNAFWLRVQKL